MCATRTSAPASCATSSTCCSTATSISSWRSRSREFPRRGGRCRSRRREQTPSFGTPAASDDITGGIGWQGLAEIQRFVERRRAAHHARQRLHAGARRRHRARRASRVRRRAAHARAAAAPRQPPPRQEAITRTPGAHVRVSFAQPDHPIAYGYPARTLRFPPELPAICDAAPLAANGVLHDLPRWSARSERRGDANGATATARRSLVSGQAWGESESGRASRQSSICPRVAGTSSRSTSIRCTAISIAAISGCCGTR